jgi:uncharacterized protein involved in type VI secretion and phage assembly
MTPWIRIAQPHGGDNKGFYFLPEIDEEVMVGFENGNAEKPYVIGTLYHGQQRPDNNWYNDNNDIKAIRTRSGHTIEFHDTEGSEHIKIYDNEKNNFVLTFSTHEQLIKLESSGNIELHAKKDVIIDAEENVTINAGKDISSEAGKDILISAKENVTITSNKDTDISSGKNASFTVSKNFDMTVSGDTDISVGKNLLTNAGKKANLTADDIEHKSNKSMRISAGSKMEQKAGSSMKIDGGTKMDINATNVKIK